MKHLKLCDLYGYIVTQKGTSPFQSEENGQGFIPRVRNPRLLGLI